MSRLLTWYDETGMQKSLLMGNHELHRNGMIGGYLFQQEQLKLVKRLHELLEKRINRFPAEIWDFCFTIPPMRIFRRHPLYRIA